jgi:tetratricopeptide (TPR) repeat protein
MAVYMLGHAFLAFYLGVVEWMRNRRGASWVFIALGVFFSFLVYETSTRGTILGLVGGILLALAIFAVFGKHHSRKMRGVSAGVILLIVLLGAGLVAAKNTAFVKGSPTLNRLATISWNENKTQARGYIWPVAVRGAFSSPKTTLIGWGQENFNYIFNANYNPNMWSQEQWFDRAHSVYLDWLVAAGVVGLLVYLSLYVFALIYIWKSSLTFAEKCVMTGLFVGYAIHNVFVFDNIASYMIFFTLLGFAHTLSESRSIKFLEASDQKTENQIVVRDYIFAPVAVIAFVLIFYFVNVRPIQANHRLIAGLVGCSGSNTPSTVPFEKALALNQYVANQEIREQVMNCAANVLGSGLPQDLKQSFYNLALSQIDAQIKAAPNDARAYVLGGTFLSGIGNEGSIPLLTRALELSPNKQSIMVELGSAYLNLGKTKEGFEVLRNAFELAPENTSARSAYITALIMGGDEKKAQEIAGDVKIDSDAQFLNAYIRLKRYDRVIAIYKNLVAQDPNNIQYQGGLAAAYFENGQKSLALAQLEMMKEKFPIQKDQIEAAINQVKNGK